MPRARSGVATRQRRNKVLKAAKGYRERKHSTYKAAAEQLLHSLSYAYRDRRRKKRDFRQLWIARINAAARAQGVRYSVLMNWISRANIEVDRKILADIALADPAAFGRVMDEAKKHANA